MPTANMISEGAVDSIGVCLVGARGYRATTLLSVYGICFLWVASALSGQGKLVL